jgi:hypothetical protein
MKLRASFGNRRCFVAGITVLLTGLCGQVSASSIAGIVTTQDGQPVKGARILMQPQSAGSAMGKNSQPSAADGGFNVDSLAAGSYTLCVQVPGTQLLDPCRWSATPPTVMVSDSQTITGLQINLQQGALIKVHVNDTGGFLNIHEGRTPGAHLLVGVWTDKGLFYRTQRALLRSLRLSGRPRSTIRSTEPCK